MVRVSVFQSVYNIGKRETQKHEPLLYIDRNTNQYYIQTETQKHEPLLYIDRNTNQYYIQTETQTIIIYRIVVCVFVFISCYYIGMFFCLYIIVVCVSVYI
jgi:hypothetical protein